jgi:hypothetical protein
MLSTGQETERRLSSKALVQEVVATGDGDGAPIYVSRTYIQHKLTRYHMNVTLTFHATVHSQLSSASILTVSSHDSGATSITILRPSLDSDTHSPSSLSLGATWSFITYTVCEHKATRLTAVITGLAPTGTLWHLELHELFRRARCVPARHIRIGCTARPTASTCC